MSEWLFLLALSGVLSGLFWWGFRTLPGEKWQILATLPVRRGADGAWQGVNLTWYGLLTANAYLVAVAMLVLLLGAITVPLHGILLTALVLLALCVPASKLVARIVEGKAHTFTVGGAVFVGLVVSPLVVWLVDRLSPELALPLLPTLAALAIAYAFGEGLGRLACISFGCCYGKPLDQCGPLLRRLFSRCNFTFVGATKKIAYADDLEGRQVVPVQGITAVLYALAGLAGCALFLGGYFGSAYLLVIAVTQGWRVISETVRSDYRGKQRFSAYQVLALLALPYALVVALLSPSVALAPDLVAGLELIWQPLPLVVFQGVWLALFWYTGRSSVTGATLSFHVHHDRV